MIRARRKAIKATGNCYKEAAEFLMMHAPHGFSDMRLAHGTCTGKEAIAGIAFGHAWVETDDLVFTMNNVIRKDAYYRIGECRNVHRYTLDQACNMMLEHEHYGPWDQDSRQVDWGKRKRLTPVKALGKVQ